MSTSEEKRRGGRSRVERSIILGSLTNVGMVRQSNQDAYCAILAPNAPPGTDALLAVADGMGGHQAGEVASAMTIRGLVNHLSEHTSGSNTTLTGERLTNILAEVVQQVNAEVHQAAAQPETRGMGSTLTVALTAGSSLAIGHVGDSRVYLLRNGQMRQLSHDHSWVAEEVARGAITPEQARTHRNRNIITRAIGIAPKVDVDTMITEMEEGDTIMLCSDGLHGLVTDEEIAKALTELPPQEACQTLVDRANALGGHDNITVVVARLDRLAKGAPPSRQKRDEDQAKTVQVEGPKGVQEAGKARRIILRILLFLVLLPLRIVKLLARGLWAVLRFALRRRKR